MQANQHDLRVMVRGAYDLQKLRIQMIEAVSVNCWNCHKCLCGQKTDNGLPITATRMILCAICGNKRCPHASDHTLECTGSNDPGQPGSVYR